MWLAGGGVKGGQTIGATDEFGLHAVEDRLHVHDLHATILHLLGLDHTKLVYMHKGRPERADAQRGRGLREDRHRLRPRPPSRPSLDAASGGGDLQLPALDRRPLQVQVAEHVSGAGGSPGRRGPSRRGCAGSTAAWPGNTASPGPGAGPGRRPPGARSGRSPRPTRCRPRTGGRRRRPGRGASPGGTGRSGPGRGPRVFQPRGSRRLSFTVSQPRTKLVVNSPFAFVQQRLVHLHLVRRRDHLVVPLVPLLGRSSGSRAKDSVGSGLPVGADEHPQLVRAAGRPDDPLRPAPPPPARRPPVPGTRGGTRRRSGIDGPPCSGRRPGPSPGSGPASRPRTSSVATSSRAVRAMSSTACPMPPFEPVMKSILRTPSTSSNWLNISSRNTFSPEKLCRR